jgi:phage tail-like protein
VAGVSKVSALSRTTEVVTHREGGDPSSNRKAPGRTNYEAVTLERGVTHDTEFEKWANKVWNFGSALGAEASLKDFRKDIQIEFYNEAGQLAISYNVYRCWVSEYHALPELDANANAVAIQTLKLENEGWERDYAVTEPTEPSFTEPT